MADTTFTNGVTLTDAGWFNDINDLFYTYLGGQSGGSPGTCTFDLKFTDATYDIGKTGATRPRDLFISRNATIGGLTAGAFPFASTGGLLVDGYITKNAAINGSLYVTQAGTVFTSTTTPANSDDTYLFDQWTLLSDGNDIVDVSREATTIPTGGLFSMALDVETANKKFGMIQFIEQRDCIGYIGNTCTLSFKARKGGSNATVGTMRAAIISWDGTADAVTSDVVSAWNVSGTNPTLVANWTYENTPADLTLTTSFQTFSVSAAVDTASAKNIALFLYYNNADGTVADFIYVADVQLERGSTATGFERTTIQEQLNLAKRYQQAWISTGTSEILATGQNLDTTTCRIVLPLSPEMRVAPTGIVVSDVTHFALAQADGTSATASNIVFSQASKYALEVVVTVAAVLVAGNANRMRFISASGTLRTTGGQL